MRRSRPGQGERSAPAELLCTTLRAFELWTDTALWGQRLPSVIRTALEDARADWRDLVGLSPGMHLARVVEPGPDALEVDEAWRKEHWLDYGHLLTEPIDGRPVDDDALCAQYVRHVTGYPLLLCSAHAFTWRGRRQAPPDMRSAQHEEQALRRALRAPGALRELAMWLERTGLSPEVPCAWLMQAPHALELRGGAWTVRHTWRAQPHVATEVSGFDDPEVACEFARDTLLLQLPGCAALLPRMAAPIRIDAPRNPPHAALHTFFELLIEPCNKVGGKALT